MTTELAIVENVNNMNPLEVFRPDNVSDIIERIKQEAANFEGNPDTDKGREEIASFCYKIRRTKTTIDDLGKELVSEWKAKSKAVDMERKRLRDTLDELTADLYQPVQAYKDAEEARKKAHEDRIRDMQTHIEMARINTGSFSSADIQDRREKINSLFIGIEWEEFSEEANRIYSEGMAIVDQAADTIKEREAKDAELERLRAAEEKRKQEETEAEAQKQKEENERLKAEANAAHEKAEKERLEREKLEQAEKDRLEKEAADHKAQEERERNNRHKGKINREARDDIMLALGDAYSEDDAKKIVSAIAQGKIRHVSIKY